MNPRIKKIALGMMNLAKGTARNMKEGMMKNFDPNAKGGMANFMAQIINLRKRKKDE